MWRIVIFWSGSILKPELERTACIQSDIMRELLMLLDLKQEVQHLTLLEMVLSFLSCCKIPKAWLYKKTCLDALILDKAACLDWFDIFLATMRTCHNIQLVLVFSALSSHHVPCCAVKWAKSQLNQPVELSRFNDTAPTFCWKVSPQCDVVKMTDCNTFLLLERHGDAVCLLSSFGAAFWNCNSLMQKDREVCCRI